MLLGKATRECIYFSPQGWVFQANLIAFLLSIYCRSNCFSSLPRPETPETNQNMHAPVPCIQLYQKEEQKNHAGMVFAMPNFAEDGYSYWISRFPDSYTTATATYHTTVSVLVLNKHANTNIGAPQLNYMNVIVMYSRCSAVSPPQVLEPKCTEQGIIITGKGESVLPIRCLGGPWVRGPATFQRS